VHDFIQPQRILVTGGADSLAPNLSLLAETGHEVLCVDNLFTGTSVTWSILHGHPFEFIA